MFAAADKGVGPFVSLLYRPQLPASVFEICQFAAKGEEIPAGAADKQRARDFFLML